MKLRHLARVLLYPFSPFREIQRPRYPVDRELVSKQLREGERLRAAGIVPKAVRR